jgi:hypothetical protein
LCLRVFHKSHMDEILWGSGRRCMDLVGIG